MKTKRRLFAMTCSLLILLFLPMNAYAAGIPDAASTAVIPPEDGAVTHVNEFQQLILLKCMPEKELAAQGYSKEDITAIKEFSLEEALLERAQYSEADLLGMGYSPEEVQLLKSYNGEEITPDNLSTYAVLSGELSSYCEIVRKWSDMIDVRYHWEWTKVPTNRFLDLIGCGWVAYNADGIKLLTSANISRCVSHVVYTPWNSTEIDHIRNYVVSNTEWDDGMLTLNSFESTAEAKILIYGKDGYFGRYGYLQISIVPDGSQAEMEGAKFQFIYAHETVSVTPSISLGIIDLDIDVLESDGEIDRKFCHVKLSN